MARGIGWGEGRNLRGEQAAAAAAAAAAHRPRPAFLYSARSLGHVWAAVKGVQRLAQGKGKFAAISNSVAFSANAMRGAVFCASAEQRAQAGMSGMQALLRDIALHGWASFTDEDDPRVELISKRNVGGVVMIGALAPGIPEAAWAASPESIVVATNQAMRMLLAKRLLA